MNKHHQSVGQDTFSMTIHAEELSKQGIIEGINNMETERKNRVNLLRQQFYKEHKGHYCPVCASEEITCTSPEFKLKNCSIEHVTTSVTCHHCNASWKDVFILHCFTELEEFHTER